MAVLLLPACSSDKSGRHDAPVVPEGLAVRALAGGNGVLDVIALTLKAGRDGTELYAALKNHGDIPACDAAFSVELFDKTEQSIAAGIAHIASLALERLCRTYWYPLYVFLRQQGKSPEDAEDLTQAFFAHLMEKDALKNVVPERGRFRSFLLSSLKHFVTDNWKKEHALKRGGQARLIELDAEVAEDRYRYEPVERLDPEKLFERRWAETILEQAANRLQEEYAANGKAALFDEVKDFQPGAHGPVSYKEIGARLDMTESAIKSFIHRMRRRHREIVREEIAHTVSQPEEIDEEIRYLLTVLST